MEVEWRANQMITLTSPFWVLTLILKSDYFASLPLISAACALLCCYLLDAYRLLGKTRFLLNEFLILFIFVCSLENK